MRRRPRSTPGLGYELHAGIATLQLDRPRQGNRIDLALAQGLCDAAEEIEQDEQVRVVVLRASGRSFCLGMDTEAAPVSCIAALAALTRPVVAVLQGDAVGEGCELALACDVRLCSTQVRFGLPQLTTGHLPRHGATQRLPRLIGSARALDLLLGGRMVDAREAVAIGLASRVVTPTRLPAAAAELAERLAGMAPLALRYVKEAVWKGADMTLAQGMHLEEDLYALLQTSRDRREGVEAFLEKRAPRFRGR